jgi:hypothetical protein
MKDDLIHEVCRQMTEEILAEIKDEMKAPKPKPKGKYKYM